MGYDWVSFIKDHAKRQRQEIFTFIKGKEVLSFAEACQFLENPNPTKRLYGIISPAIVQVLDYSPVRKVFTIRKANQKEIKYLIQYWLQKYEIDVANLKGGFEYLVELLFLGDSYFFPANLIDIYALEEK